MKCEIIAGPYYSNCFIEAIRAKIKNKKTKLYFCKPYLRPDGSIGSMHVMWADNNYSYDFSDLNWSDNGKFWQYWIYKGYIRQWPRDFARRFSKFRNSGRKGEDWQSCEQTE